MGGRCRHLIISNNPLIMHNNSILTTYRLKSKEELREVFIETRDLIHRNASLLIHPLSGSIEPYRNPFRTIAVNDANCDFDLDSLKTIETAFARYRGNWPDENHCEYDREILNDFKKLDFNLIKNFIDKNE